MGKISTWNLLNRDCLRIPRNMGLANNIMKLSRPLKKVLGKLN
jgi:hypothetical protein